MKPWHDVMDTTKLALFPLFEHSNHFVMPSASEFLHQITPTDRKNNRPAAQAVVQYLSKHPPRQRLADDLWPRPDRFVRALGRCSAACAKRSRLIINVEQSNGRAYLDVKRDDLALQILIRTLELLLRHHDIVFGNDEALKMITWEPEGKGYDQQYGIYSSA